MKAGQHGKDAALEEQVYLAKWKRKGAERQRRTTAVGPRYLLRKGKTPSSLDMLLRLFDTLIFPEKTGFCFLQVPRGEHNNVGTVKLTDARQLLWTILQ